MRSHAAMPVFALALLGATHPASAYTLSGTYYEDQLTKACPGTNACLMTFALPAATTGMFLNVNFVACNGFAPGAISQAVVAIGDAPVGPFRRFQSLGVGSTLISGKMDWRAQIEMKVTGGPPRHVIISVESGTTGAWTIGCSITGQLSTE